MEHDIFRIALGIGILALMYGLLITEKMHRTAAALFCAAVVAVLNVFLRFTSFDALIESVDMDTILLLMSMMIIVTILSKTGIFDYIAITILRAFLHRPYMLIVTLSTVTAVISAFLDNVTTVLLITPLVIEVSRMVRVDPRPVLLAIVFSSNIGGTATLIGDPPNILIGSAAELGFMDFIRNLTPIVALDFLAFLALLKVMNRGWIAEYNRIVSRMVSLPHRNNEVDKELLRRTFIALAIVISLFVLEDFLGYPPAIPALIGVGILMLLVGERVSIEDVLKGVDWSTLVFFMAMFIVIRGVEDLGVVDFIAECICYASSNYVELVLIIVWVSALFSALVDNIPFVMTMIPVIKSVAASLAVDPTPLYWALSLGACLGGNGTLVGASANVVVAGIADKHGYHISFRMFSKYGMPVMLLTVALSSIYLIFRYCNI